MSYETEARLNELAGTFEAEWDAATDVEPTGLGPGQGQADGPPSQTGGEGNGAGGAAGSEGRLLNPDFDKGADGPSSTETTPQSSSNSAASIGSRAESALHEAIDRAASFGNAILEAARGLFAGDQSSTGMSASDLTAAAQRAYELHPDYCNFSVAAVANAYGNHDLDGKRASEQLAKMDSDWREVSGSEAQRLANQGTFVVAGYPGHTAVVTPGSMKTHGGESYPMVTGGGSDRGRSDGTRSVGDVWRPDVRDDVRYFTPR